MSSGKKSSELLVFIDKLLEEARKVVTNQQMETVNSTVQVAETDNSNEKQQQDLVSEEFKKNFPGLCKVSSGKALQSYLPNIKRSHSTSFANNTRPNARYPYTGRVLNTWTHEFVCLADVRDFTPTSQELEVLRKAGLGKKKIVFKSKNGDHSHVRETIEGYFPRLKCQDGAFQLSRATSGGCGVRRLVKLNCTVAGYTVQGLKEEVKASTVYIVPLNTRLDTTPLTVCDLVTEQPLQDGILSRCKFCNVQVPLWEFPDHRLRCEEAQEEEQAIETDSDFATLKSMFPNRNEQELKEIYSSVSGSIDEAVEILLEGEAKKQRIEIPKNVIALQSSRSLTLTSNTGSTSTSHSSPSSSSTSKSAEYYDTFEDLLNKFQQNVSKETFTLKVNRDEIWRNAISFYKRSLKDPSLLKQKLQIEFGGAAEADSSDAGALTIEYFDLIMNEFDQRVMVGETSSRVPRRGDSLNFTLFGIAIGHSIIQGGPGYYRFQDWVYEILSNSSWSDDFLMGMITKEMIPIHAGSGDLIKFLDAINDIESQECLDDLIDKNITIVNCSRWDPTVPVTMKNKYLLASEIIYDELVRKRIPQLHSIVEGLNISGLLPHIRSCPKICKNIFCWKMEDISSDAFLALIKDSEKQENLSYEKRQSQEFFTSFINETSTEIRSKVLSFTTGFSRVPPWGIGDKISVKYLRDDDDKIYPEAMACFNIIYLPTVHSSKKAFSEHVVKALNIEGKGFAAPF